MKILLFLSVVTCVMTQSACAYAVPAPMSAEDLLAASDLVTLVRVLSVTCVAIVHRESEDLRRYTAELGLLRVRKGEHRRYDVVEVEWEETPKGVLGPWYVPYYPGGLGWTHLVRGNGTYHTTWWNAADWRRFGNRGLPQRVMKTKRAPLLVRGLFRIPRALYRLQRKLTATR
jgi:hypothetical protein